MRTCVLGGSGLHVVKTRDGTRCVAKRAVDSNTADMDLADTNADGGLGKRVPRPPPYLKDFVSK
jgi:hypothetical protein